jgi:hypothetical protein
MPAAEVVEFGQVQILDMVAKEVVVTEVITEIQTLLLLEPQILAGVAVVMAAKAIAHLGQHKLPEDPEL